MIVSRSVFSHCKQEVFRLDSYVAIGLYAISRQEPEEGLHELARETDLKVVVIRSVLVYGPGVKGNVLSMMRWLEKGIPLPFGRIDNQRSMVALHNGDFDADNKPDSVWQNNTDRREIDLVHEWRDVERELRVATDRTTSVADSRGG